MKEEDIISIIIMTDSTCDISKEDQSLLHVEIIPLTVQFDGISYRDGIDITNEQFYDKLDRCEQLPTTSQITPQTFADAFQRHLNAGDEVVGIFISSEISGTYNSACVAKQILDSDHLHIVDSRSATMSLALLVFEAAKHRDSGHSAKQIAEYITALSHKVRFFTVINTLKYLRKGGRIPATTAIIGEVLGMKPIVSIMKGTIHTIGKARGMQAALNSILQKILNDLPDLRYKVVFAHSCSPALLEKAVNRFQKPLQLVDYLTCSVGSVIGTYAGRGAVGFAYIAQQTHE